MPHFTVASQQKVLGLNPAVELVLCGYRDVLVRFVTDGVSVGLPVQTVENTFVEHQKFLDPVAEGS